ncbi:hypothetical protein [Nonomuraea sp. SYSU D8015]|uniref:hypothetical protein n=1 Tax=Nonomuraea sp. SYSU D8015 TaxID=2593644 RepID=UPI001661504D|nr:hypothetical protein [Nonomuraea sp. SYSU D8015]
MPDQIFSEQPGDVVDAPVSPAPTSDSRYTAEDIQRARQQEKDKLYGRLTEAEERTRTMQSQLEELLAARKAEDDAKAEAERQRAEAERQKAEEEMSVRDLVLQQKAEFEAKLAAIEAERERERVLFQKEKEMAQLQAYIQTRVNEERERIAPQLLDLITGNSPEEVEASIATMIAKTDAITSELAAAQTALAAEQQGVSPYGYTPMDGPMDNSLNTKTYSNAELNDMPISEWAKIRGQVIGASASNRGIFG